MYGSRIPHENQLYILESSRIWRCFHLDRGYELKTLVRGQTGGLHPSDLGEKRQR